MPDARVIPPGSTLGVFGGGQLGRMFVMAAARLGYRTVVFDPQPDAPAAQLSHDYVAGDFRDEGQVRRFAERCDVVTLEFENVPVAAVRWASEYTLVRPGAEVLSVAQHRLRERAFLTGIGAPVAIFQPVRSAAELETALRNIGTPVILKSAEMGYDGRGQIRIEHQTSPSDAWNRFGVNEALCEQVVDFDCELSVLVARSPTGQIQTFGPIRNVHERHILDLSVVPADVGWNVADQADELARDIAANLCLEGIMCVEMFLTKQGTLLVNELAPRPHNSGHLTIDACDASQFEQQVRAICGLPLSPMTLRSPAAMANVLGDLWRNGTPAWTAALDASAVRLHLYGKGTPRPGRKMGHIVALGASADEAQRCVVRARDRLTNSTTPKGREGDSIGHAGKGSALLGATRSAMSETRSL